MIIIFSPYWYLSYNKILYLSPRSAHSSGHNCDRRQYRVTIHATEGRDFFHSMVLFNTKRKRGGEADAEKVKKEGRGEKNMGFAQSVVVPNERWA